MDIVDKIRDKSAVICIVGLGYVGLPTAVIFAEKGFKVIGVNRRLEIAQMINRGRCHLSDLNLDERVKNVVQDAKLTATTNTSEATRLSDAILITVPTPVTADKRPDLTHVISAGEDITKGLSKYKLVVLESTVYPGVVEDVLQPILEQSGLKAGTDFGLAYCPERYNPGDNKHTISNVARIVGGITPECGDITVRLYENIVREVFLVKDVKTAEAAKVIENIQRDLNIALMNELALIFEKMNIDIMDVIAAAATKWNFNVYYPGAGVGGHCLPVDPYYLVKKAEELGYHSKVITAGRAINDFMPMHIVDLLVDTLNDCEKALKNAKIVVLGFSYKENLGDPRESHVKTFVSELKRKGASVHIIDPHIKDDDLAELGIKKSDSYSAIKDADALVLMTAHNEFKRLNLEKAKKCMHLPILIDGRRMFDQKAAEKIGFIYRGVGSANK